MYAEVEGNANWMKMCRYIGQMVVGICCLYNIDKTEAKPMLVVVLQCKRRATMEEWQSSKSIDINFFSPMVDVDRERPTGHNIKFYVLHFFPPANSTITRATAFSINIRSTLHATKFQFLFIVQ